MMMWLAAVLSFWMQGQPPVVVVFETAVGNFEVAVDVAHAPITAANFLKYVDDGAYNGGAFHRAVRPDTETRTDFPIQVVQASTARGSKSYPAIPLERTSVTGLKHVAGAISYGRAGPDTATSDFFVCVTDTPELDFGGKRNADGQGFGAFGQVVSGMDVIKKIQSSPTQAEGNKQTLKPQIAILKAYRK
ncbi:MAG: peptidylprolyl isomerase [Acidobacteriota bacterium]